jgi:hypothetical protein
MKTLPPFFRHPGPGGPLFTLFSSMRTGHLHMVRTQLTDGLGGGIHE